MNIRTDGCVFYGVFNVGGTVVSTRAFHLCDTGSIPARCSCQIKNFTLSHVRIIEECFQFDSIPNTAGFLRVLRFPPVQISDQ